MSYPITTPQPSSLQAKVKNLMQKTKKNIRKINFKKAVAQKFREYDQKLEALTNFNVSEAFEKAHPYLKWFPKKSGLAKRRTTWFGLLLKSDIDKNENHILGPSTIAIAKKFKELIQKDELTIADLEGARLEWLKDGDRINFFKAEISTRTEGSIYSNLRIKSVVRVVVKKKWGSGLIYNIVLSEVKKFCDDTLIKIHENLVDTVKRNKLSSGNKRLKGRDWSDIDVEKSNEMVDKIDKTLKQQDSSGGYILCWRRPKTCYTSYF
ncbi:hypothetical protein Tco_0888176 [Tanacetum coccineum]